MENGVEALKLASSVLIFVIAITITISAFTMAAQALNRIFASQDADKYVQMVDDKGNSYFLNFVRFGGGTREVGIETIIPSIYRAYKENYAIYFYNSDGTGFTIRTETKNEGTSDEEKISINYIDAEKESHDPDKLEEDINKLLYGENGLYEKLIGKTFTEKLGEYYMNDENGVVEGIAEVNKTKKRVIVYIESI